ncbi:MULTISPECIES: hypothetical protein [unclassified Arthrobacter]|uniref:hypothetical protein n=1 Tax=unclassified Arthrobacter TaxID=235627 RepID=UPI00149269E2|nr:MULTISPECIES: hypothetical protein [unclassified Arthrobacter]MBE0010136.1 hypothetical protein [Arthrobacter sp. AET 35A]NOJ64080.1 hypothetical protein [Arthrobacter sp. 147(2020)]
MQVLGFMLTAERQAQEYARFTPCATSSAHRKDPGRDIDTRIHGRMIIVSSRSKGIPLVTIGQLLPMSSTNWQISVHGLPRVLQVISGINTTYY